jgi:hypothetical protein
MTPEQKRIAIAEACPTVFHINRFSDGKTQITWAVNRNFHGEVKTVDPLNDLNAMAKARKTLTPDQQVQFSVELGKLTTAYLPSSRAAWMDFTLIHATADQHADAFIATADQHADAFIATADQHADAFIATLGLDKQTRTTDT